jgi:transcriptional regulator with XRE-family HTH domain
MLAVDRQSLEEHRELRLQGGRWLKSVREQANLSQRQLAAAVGIDTYSFVSQLEAGRGRVPSDRYQSWAKAVGMPAAEFVRTLMRFYEPNTYEILFGSSAEPEAPVKSDTKLLADCD